MKYAKHAVFLGILFNLFFNCATPHKRTLTGITKRAYETRVYEISYEDAWKATMTLFQDLDIMPTFTDKNSGLIKAEVPYQEGSRTGQAIGTVLFGVAGALLYKPTKGVVNYTAFITELSQQKVSIRFLGIRDDGKRVWKEKECNQIHMRLQELINQLQFLKGTGTEVE